MIARWCLDGSHLYWPYYPHRAPRLPVLPNMFFPPFLIVGWTKHVNVTHQRLLLVFTPAQLYLDVVWTTKIVQKAVEKAELEMKCHHQLWSKHEQLRHSMDEVIGLTR